VAVTLAGHHLWQRSISRRLRNQAAKYAKEQGRKEVALVVSTRHDIQQAVLAHLDKDGRKDIPLLCVHQQEGFGDREEQWIAYLERVKKEIRKIREEGFSRVYVFANVPVAMALLVGATLTNGPEAVIHQFTNGPYQPVARLTIETIRL
jgi:hypothetical protein